MKDPQEYTSGEIQAMLDELSTKIETLRIRYEQYFMGVERRAPVQIRKDVARLIRDGERAHITNTAQKYHYRQLVQKFNTYSTYWNRILRQIEDGTYKRHIQKANRRAGVRAARMRQGATPRGERTGTSETTGIGDAADAFLASLESGGLFEDFVGDGGDDWLSGGDSGVFRAATRPDTGLNPVVDPFGGGSGSAGRRSPTGSFAARSLASASSGPSNPFQSRPDTGLNPVVDPFGGPGGSSFGARPDSGLNPVLDPFASSSAAPETPARATSPTPPPVRPRRAGSVPPPVRPRRGGAATASGPPAPPSPAGGEGKGREVYQQFVEARQKCGINKELSYDKFERSLRKQEQAVRQKHGGKQVDFRVIVKNGKPILQPVVKS